MRLLLVCFISIGFLVLSCKQEQEKQFSITGMVKNRDIKMVYLEEMPVAAMQSLVVDSAFVGKDGKFSLKAKSKEEGIYNLRVDDDMYPFTSLINDADKISVEVDFNNEGQTGFYTIKGSPSSQAVKEYLTRSGEMMREIYMASRRLDSLQETGKPDSTVFLIRAARDANAKKLKDFTQQQIQESKSPALAMFVLRTYQGTSKNPAFRIESFDNDAVGTILTELTGKFPAHEGIASIKRSFDEQVNAGLVGKTAPEIALPDTEGKEIKLSSFRGKYVLVDFWASWCKPCRAENPNIVAAYNKYKNKNFTILGVSLDQSKAPWVKAIVDDDLNWTHISDLKLWSSPVVPLYQIESIPFNVLVDPNGKVVAKNLRGPGLQEKLEEILD